jgi:dolichyl-diphosphooligosaccharide--protein glycosyltransferase
MTPTKTEKSKSKNAAEEESSGIKSMWPLVVAPTILILTIFAWHCTYVTSSAYSSPSVVLASRNQDGSPLIIDDFREAYYWLRQNVIFANLDSRKDQNNVMVGLRISNYWNV